MTTFEHTKSRIRGPVVGLLTPFHDDGSIDPASLPAYVEHQVDAGLDVLAFSPMISSLCVLTPEEVLEVAAETKRIAGDRALVLGSTRGDSPVETFGLLRGFEDSGLDGAFVFPGYLGPKPDVYARLLHACCDVTSMPILGFQVSVEFDRRFGGLSWMSVDDWARLADRSQIIGLKDDTGNVEGRRALAGRLGDRFAVVGPGMGERYVEVHDLPGQAELTSIGDLDAAAERSFHDALDAGDGRKARSILKPAMACLTRICAVMDLGWGIEPVQAIAHARGLIESPAMRAPLPSPGPEQIDAVRRLVEQYDRAKEMTA
ncbi:MAG: hypothetical protein CMJ18_09655 [Phycisphaeraceae bacterium]|nr:hypothetical protein [Phycisphaeraceae bacterium]